MNKGNYLRTPQMQQKYLDYRASETFKNRCGLCKDDAIKTFKLWKIIPNDFPYDNIASVHHMLVPLRHAAESDVTEEEWAEFNEIKALYVQHHYGIMIEPTIMQRSIPGHYHLHLIVLRED